MPASSPGAVDGPHLERPLWAISRALGSHLVRFLIWLGAIASLTGRCVSSARHKFEWGLSLSQVYYIGIQSLSITFLTAAFVGMIMTLQFQWGLERFGAALYAGKLVSLSFVMELGPTLTAVLVGGRVGAGMTAELGSMSVTEQIDAIRALGADPVGKLVVPRVLASVISLPVLVMIANVVGIFGSMVINTASVGITPRFFWDQVVTTVDVSELMHGIIKSVFFGYFIGIIGCAGGLGIRGGTVGVGLGTTRTVVVTSVTILVGDFFLTKLLLPLT